MDNAVVFGYLILHKNFIGKLNKSPKDFEILKESWRLFLKALRNGELEITRNQPIPKDFRIAFNYRNRNPDLIVYAATDLTAVLRQEMPLPDMTLALNWIEDNGFSVVDKKPTVYGMSNNWTEDFFYREISTE